MMKARGHTVFLYAGDQNEAPCDELVTCISESERAAAVGNRHYVESSFDRTLPHWRTFNENVVRGIKERAEAKDFVCVIGGVAHQAIAHALPSMMTVEFGIGYGGTFAKYRVFESYAWMHTVCASGCSSPHDLNGRWFDAVIPNYFEPELFPFQEKKGDYFLFIGRLIDRKGFQIAADACERIGARLILAGHGNPPSYGEHVGVVGPERRGELMSRAKAVFVPTQYIEPFGGVAVEAMLCGTPVITTDWGAFTETVVQGHTGFRCRTMGEFCDAATKVGDLDAEFIRRRAIAKYSLDAVAPQYETYFNRLDKLWGDGWYS
jgi:hypothetical protein